MGLNRSGESPKRRRRTFGLARRRRRFFAAPVVANGDGAIGRVAGVGRVFFVVFAFAVSTVSFVAAQETAPEWDALFERRDGWLAADGIYSIDLNRDDAETSESFSTSSSASSSAPNLASNLASKAESDAPPKTFFWFSDTFGGTTRGDGREFDSVRMTNHSFALLDGRAPAPGKIRFFWRRDFKKPRADASTSGVAGTDSNADSAENLLGVKRWLQDGILYRERIWLSAILVGDAWKPERVDAVSIGRDADGGPNFDDVRVDENAPLSFKANGAQVVFGAAINDDANDGFLYIFGYLDRFDVGSRKDLVVARVARDRFDDFSAWRYFDGNAWSPNVADACSPNAALLENVSTEFSVSKIPTGKNAGKFLLVYTPGVVSDRIAFRVAQTPIGPFENEVVFYRSTVPRAFEPGVRCYNAKAHPVLSDENRLLVSYNVNRLGEIPRRPAEYRPRFVWLEYRTVDATSEQ